MRKISAAFLTGVISASLMLSNVYGGETVETITTENAERPAAPPDGGPGGNGGPGGGNGQMGPAGTPPDGGQAPDGQVPPDGMGGPGGGGRQGSVSGNGGPGGGNGQMGPAGAPPDGGQAPDGQAPPDGMGGPGGGGRQGSVSGNGGPGGAQKVTEWEAANSYTEDETVENLTVDSTAKDENAVHVSNGATVYFKNLNVKRENEESSGGDSASFYGVGAAVLNTGGTAIIDGAGIETDSSGGAGVFSYGDGVTYLKDAVIKTAQDTSGGIHAAGGGTLYAYNVTAETDGASAAAIRSDRGGGTMVVDGGSYKSNGSGSPALYCTADISVHDATLTATGSEGLCLEGLNTVRLFDTDLSSNMPDDKRNDTTWSVILYQSMSGDSEVGKGSFEMVGGSLKNSNGGLFYTTNTESSFYLSEVDITPAEENSFFLKATGNSNERGWGRSGENGADCSFTADSQECTGDVIYDSISNLDFYLLNGSTLTGAVIEDESNAGNGGDGKAVLTIDEGSKWVVTGDSSLRTLHSAGSIVDSEGKTVTIVGAEANTVYVEGDSDYTVFVDSFDTDVDVSGAAEKPSWETYEVSDEITAKYFGSAASDDSIAEESIEKTEAVEEEAPKEEDSAAATSAPATEEGSDQKKGGIPILPIGLGAGALIVALVYFLKRKK